MKTPAFLLLTLLAATPTFARQEAARQMDSTIAVVRCDDAGMCHAVNMAFKEVAESGLPFSASVMTPCPWFTEAAEILRNFPNVSVGIHLTLNAEWKGYRWGPVLGAAAVPSLVDSLGNFFPTRAALMEHGPKPEEVEKELRAQIRRAYAAGLHPDYVDYHMGAAVGTPELRAIVEKLAAEFHLGISRYFGEVYPSGLYFAPYSNKTDTLVNMTHRLKRGARNLLVFHIGQATPEMDALVDFNAVGLPEMSKHREGERRALLSQQFREALASGHILLRTYRDLVRTDGLKSMRAPEP